MQPRKVTMLPIILAVDDGKEAGSILKRDLAPARPVPPGNQHTWSVCRGRRSPSFHETCRLRSGGRLHRDRTHSPIPKRRSTTLSAVVWATGYRDNTSWITIPEAKRLDGGVIQTRGISSVHGLYYVGRSWQWTRGSALVLGVGKDASYMADQIVRSDTTDRQPAQAKHPASSANLSTASGAPERTG